MDIGEQRAREIRLELLLRELLREATPDWLGLPVEGEVAQEVTALRDMARRLRAAVQSAPLPAGWIAVRRVLVATAGRRHHTTPSLTRLRRSNVWRSMSVVAAAVIMGVCGIGTGMAWGVHSPSSPWYGVRVALEEVEVALIPDRLRKAEMLLKTTRIRIAEVQAMAGEGDLSGLRRAADALDSEAGWLHAIMTILPAEDRARLDLRLI